MCGGIFRHAGWQLAETEAIEIRWIRKQVADLAFIQR